MCKPIFSDDDADLRDKRFNLHKDGYAKRTIGARRVTSFAHHEVCLRAFGRKPDWNKKEVCDHINRDKLDNRRENLRIVSVSENRRNSHRTDNAKYAYRVGNRWKATVSVKRRLKYLGLFETQQEARQAVLTFLESNPGIYA